MGATQQGGGGGGGGNTVQRTERPAPTVAAVPQRSERPAPQRSERPGASLSGSQADVLSTGMGGSPSRGQSQGQGHMAAPRAGSQGPPDRAGVIKKPVPNDDDDDFADTDVGDLLG